MPIKILTIIDYYRPGYKGGGPIRTLESMVDHLGDNFGFQILTRDRDLGDASSYGGIMGEKWQSIGRAQIYYLRPDSLSIRSLARIIRETSYDVLYLNSVFSSLSVKIMLARRLGWIPSKPIVIAPRGEFFAGALSIKSRKKSFYLSVARLSGLYSTVSRWHVSNTLEENTVYQTIAVSRSAIYIAPNLHPRDLPTVNVKRDLSKTLKLVFFSRISPKKNLDYALQLLMNSDLPIQLDIYGTQEDQDYWQICESIMKSLPKTVQARYCGELHPEQVAPRLSKYHALFFPTRGENYGHVIWESLYAGCSPIISDQTPWKDLEEQGIGWAIPLDKPEKFHEALQTLYSLLPETFNQRAQDAHHYAREIASNAESVAANRRLFADLG